MLSALSRTGRSALLPRQLRCNSTWTKTVEEAASLVNPKKLDDPFSIVSHEMSSLAKNIASLIGSGHPTLNRVGAYYFQTEGKHVRPLIVLLISKAFDAVPAEEHDRGSRDERDVLEQTPLLSPEPSVNDSLSPLRILHGINPLVILNPLSQPMNSLPTLEADRRNGILPKQRRLAEIVEMIHTASLLHDDVIDSSDSRRGMPSGNIAFSNKMAILAGDFLLARASVAIARLRNAEVIELLSTTIANLVEGEFMQLKNTVVTSELENAESEAEAATKITKPPLARTVDAVPIPPAVQEQLRISQEHLAADRNQVQIKGAFEYYIHKTYLKTASLMSKSCRAAAVLSGVRDPLVDAAYEFGRNLGLCFQVVDDMLDYTVPDNVLGKPAGADLQLGLATAPVLFAWEKYPELGEIIRRKFSKEGDVLVARKFVELSDGVEKTRELAKSFRDEALKNLMLLPPSEARDALESLTKTVLTRKK